MMISPIFGTMCRRCGSVAVRRWQLLSAVCVERPVRVSAERSAVEQRYQQLLQQIEFDHSSLSTHEVRVLADQVEAAKRLEKQNEDEDFEEKETVRAIDLEDMWEAERAAFTPASVETGADAAGDLTSTTRLLRQRLFLVFNQQLGKNQHWLFPQSVHQQGETLRQTAERAVLAMCGEETKAHVLGNAPFGFYKYKYPNDVSHETGYYGAKVFFYMSHLLPGSGFSPERAAYWLTDSELQQRLHPAYYRAIRPATRDF